MGKFRKKPVEVEAFKFYVDSTPDWFMDKVTSNDIIIRQCNNNRYDLDDVYCAINTVDGIVIGYHGDYIIKDDQGEVYPYKPDIFEKTYEEVE